MAVVRSINGFESRTINGSDIIDVITGSADIFIFSYSPIYKTLVSWSDNASLILGVKESAITGSGNLFLRHVHPDDRFTLLTELENAFKGRTGYRATYRWIRPDNNEVRWLHCRAKLTSGEKMEPLFEGAIFDVTEELNQQHLINSDSFSAPAVLDALPQFIVIANPELRVTQINFDPESVSLTLPDNFINLKQLQIGSPLLAAIPDVRTRSETEQALLAILSGRQDLYTKQLDNSDMLFEFEITPLLHNSAPAAVMISITDQQKLKNALQEVKRLKKMRAHHVMTAGLSHTFSDTAQEITGYATLINYSDDEYQIKESSAKIIDLSTRCARLAESLYRPLDQDDNIFAETDPNLILVQLLSEMDDIEELQGQIKVLFGTPPQIVIQEAALSATVRKSLLSLADLSPDLSFTLSTRSREFTLSSNEISSGMYAEITIKCERPSKKLVDFKGNSRKEIFRIFQIAKEQIDNMDGQASIKESGTSSFSLSILFPSSRDKGSASEGFNRRTEDTSPLNQPNMLIFSGDAYLAESVRIITEQSGYHSRIHPQETKPLRSLKKFRDSVRTVIIDADSPGNGHSHTDLSNLFREVIPGLQVINLSSQAERLKNTLPEGNYSDPVVEKPITVEKLLNLFLEADLSNQN